MSYHVTNENSFLDIKNAHLRVTGNVHTDVLKLGAIEVVAAPYQPTSSEVLGTTNFTNVTTGVTTSSNLIVGGVLSIGTVEVIATTHTLANTTAKGSVTPHTIEFSNVTTGLITTANVSVGRDLTVTGNVLISDDLTVTGNALVSSNLTVTGNVSVSDDLTVTGNVSVSDDLTVTGGVTSTTSLMSNVVTIGTTKTFMVKVGSNGKYEIDGVDRPTLQLHQHQTYIFDLSSSTLSGHPFIFSETASGSSYDTGITTTGAYGSTEKRTFVVPAGAPTTLYYFCTAQAGMGATASISSTAELMVSGRVESTDLAVTGTGGSTLGSGTTAQRPANPTLGTIRYNSTTGFMEGYAAAGWAPIAQPPTVTGISPLTTLTSGGNTVGWDTGTRIFASTAAAQDGFGWSVAMNSTGTKVIVGEANGGANSHGAAYIFALSGTTWSQEGKLVASNSLDNDKFGHSVSMSGDGTKVIVGSIASDPAGLSSAGTAYIYTYDGSTWGSEVIITASDKAVTDRFGESVSMSSDGTRVVVTSEYESPTDYYGAAYIYTYDGSTWGSEVKLVAPTRTYQDYFGSSASISGDGTKIIVGARYDDTSFTNSGAAYIFTYSSGSGSWDAGTKILAPVDADGTNDNFGWSTAINSDGTKVIVGAEFEDAGGANAGAAYIFTYSSGSGSWGAGTKIVSSDLQAGDDFGRSVAMNADGTKVLVGAPFKSSQSGSAYLFTYSDGAWDTGLKMAAGLATARIGYYVAMNSNGTTLIMGAPQEDTVDTNAGAAHIFDYNELTDSDFIFDSATQVFTATGTGIVSGSTVQLEGADGNTHSVFNTTPPNAAGTQVTFKIADGHAVAYPDIDMTSASQGGYVVTRNVEGSSEQAWRAFDGYPTTTAWLVQNGYSSTTPFGAVAISGVLPSFIDTVGDAHVGHWIQLELPNKIKLTRFVTTAYAASTSSYLMQSYVVLGSNDNTSWTLLHSETDAVFTAGVQDVTTLSGGSTSFFKYFKLLVKRSGIQHMRVGEIEYYGLLDDGRFTIANQPYKVRVSSTSGLIGTSTAAIGFAVGWTTAVGAIQSFDINSTTTKTLAGTDGAGVSSTGSWGGTFSISPLSAVQTLPAKVGGGTLVLTGSTGDITGQIAADQLDITTPVTFRLTDNGSGQFADRVINIKGVSALYSFSPNPFTFTNAGVTGQNGPTLTDLTTGSDAYSPDWTGYTSNLNVTAGIQEWTVPISGLYEIEAAGSSTGSASYSSSIYYGGYGAIMRGTFALSSGDIIKILVGQMGEVGNHIYDSAGTISGGGGGTFVIKTPYNSTGSILVIAGGGGGSSGYSNRGSSFVIGKDANTGTAGIQGGDPPGYAGGLGGTSGGGGSGVNGGAGAGFSGDGATPSGTPAGDSAQSFTDASYPSRGGRNGRSWGGAEIYGGFGGGGGGGGLVAGGGGGYSGGGCGQWADRGQGGGGGSYNSGTSQSNTIRTVRDQHGYVKITQI